MDVPVGEDGALEAAEVAGHGDGCEAEYHVVGAVVDEVGEAPEADQGHDGDGPPLAFGEQGEAGEEECDADFGEPEDEEVVWRLPETGDEQVVVACPLEEYHLDEEGGPKECGHGVAAEGEGVAFDFHLCGVGWVLDGS